MLSEITSKDIVILTVIFVIIGITSYSIVRLFT